MSRPENNLEYDNTVPYTSFTAQDILHRKDFLDISGYTSQIKHAFMLQRYQ